MTAIWLLPLWFEMYMMWNAYIGNAYAKRVVELFDVSQFIVLIMIAFVPIGGVLLLAIFVAQMIVRLIDSILLRDVEEEFDEEFD